MFIEVPEMDLQDFVDEVFDSFHVSSFTEYQRSDIENYVQLSLF